LFCFDLPGYLDPGSRIRGNPKATLQVDNSVMNLIIAETSRKEEKVFKGALNSLFVKHCKDRKVYDKLKATDHVELKGLLMLIAVASMSTDHVELEEAQIGSYLTAWSRDQNFVFAFHTFGTILFGAGESEVSEISGKHFPWDKS
jgi:hypothetical protein